MESPNARAVRRYPEPLAASQPTSIAVPHPMITSTAVPIASARYFFIMMILLPVLSTYLKTISIIVILFLNRYNSVSWRKEIVS
jgi:hypothetical protein